MAEIFISYAREDENSARRLLEELEKHGWSVFWDQHIRAGERFDDVIKEQIRSAKCVIVLWSDAVDASIWVKDEGKLALEQNKLLPVFIQQVCPPMGFGQIQAINLIGWRGEKNHPGFQRLLSNIRPFVSSSDVGTNRRDSLPKENPRLISVAPKSKLLVASTIQRKSIYAMLTLLFMVGFGWLVVSPGLKKKNGSSTNSTHGINVAPGPSGKSVDTPPKTENVNPPRKTKATVGESNNNVLTAIIRIDHDMVGAELLVDGISREKNVQNLNVRVSVAPGKRSLMLKRGSQTCASEVFVRRDLEMFGLSCY